MRCILPSIFSILAVQGLFGRGPKVDPCRCEGRWIMDIPSWQEAINPSAALKNVSHPITLDVWHSETNDPKAVRLTIKAANTITTVVNTQGKDFCAQDILLTSGMVSTRMFALGAAAYNEKAIITKLLNGLDNWFCDVKREKLTLQSPMVRVSFTKYKPEPIVEDDVVASDVSSPPPVTATA